LDLLFTNEAGKAVTLGDCADGRPVLLELGYFRCPMLCTLELNGLVAALQDLKPSAADTASVIFVSIDPSETPKMARAKKNTYMRLYGRKEAEPLWYFLTGSRQSIAKLSDEVGFRFVYDPASRQFAHPSGLVVMTADGRISRYFFGVDYVAKDLDSALRAAALRKTGGVVQQFILLCFHYDPIRGKYGALVLEAIRFASVLTLVGLAGGIWMAQRARRRKETA